MALLDGELQIPHFVRGDNSVGVISGVICRDRQGLKLASLLALGGTAQAVPFPFVEEGRSLRSAEALRHPKSSARPEFFCRGKRCAAQTLGRMP